MARLAALIAAGTVAIAAAKAAPPVGDRAPWPGARRVEATHHVIWTDLPADRDAALAADADLLYRGFVRYCAVPLGREAPRGPFDVQVYASPEAYARHASERHPGADAAPGYYDATDDTAHFLWREVAIPGMRATTMREVYLHEMTHQIWARWGRPAGPVGAHPHFWASEGIACLFETLQEVEGEPTLDIRRSLRLERCWDLQAAGGLVPLERFVQMSQRPFQSEEGADRYAQACALAAFLLTSADPPGPRRFLEYLLEIESGNGRPATFSRTIGSRPEAWDGPFAAWLSGLLESPDPDEEEPGG